MGLEQVSDWTLALLPRIFFYPGGVWLLAALVALRFAAGGLTSLVPSALASDLATAALPALSVAWVAVALLPLPGASPLAAPVDRFVLAALALVALALDRRHGGAVDRREVFIAVSITVALLAPVARGVSLLDGAPTWNLSSIFSMLCVAVGLAALSGRAARNLASAARWLAWLGLGFAPLLADWVAIPLQRLILASLVYAAGIVILAGGSRLVHLDPRDARWIMVVWALAPVSLLAALLGY